MGLVEDADAIDGGEGEQAVGDPGGKGGEHHLPDEKGSVGDHRVKVKNGANLSMLDLS